MPGSSSTKRRTNVLSQSKIVAFVATSNPDAAKSFYEQTLGLTLMADDPFAIVFDANGTMLRVQKLQTYAPPGHTVLGWDVADIGAEMKGLSERGVRFERYEWLGQDE